jgi:glutathione S-transferase
MNLYLNQASPYARLISVLLVETGLDTETELIFVDPWGRRTNCLLQTPLQKCLR